MTIYSLDLLLSQFGTSLFSMSRSNCCIFTGIQMSQEAGKVVWYSHLLKNFPQFTVIHIVKGFGIVNNAELDVFLDFSCFFMIQQLLAIWSLVPLPFLKPAWIWKFMVHVMLKPGLENFENYFTSVWGVCNCAVVCPFFALPSFEIGMKTALFQSCGHCWVFQNAGILRAALSQHHLLGFETAQLEFHHLH